MNQFPRETSIGFSIINKNGEESLEKMFSSIQRVSGQTVFVDTGSTDRSVQIAKKMGAEVYYYSWNNDFSKARNFALSKMKTSWVYSIDSDEVLDPLFEPWWREISSQKSFCKAFIVETRNYFQDVPFQVSEVLLSKGGGKIYGDFFSISKKIRIFPNMRGLSFEDPLHETIEASLKKKNVDFCFCPIPLHHLGYVLSETSQDKGEFYLDILERQKKHFKNSAKYNFDLAYQYALLGNYDKASEFITFQVSEEDQLYFQKLVLYSSILFNQKKFEQLIQWYHSLDFKVREKVVEVRYWVARAYEELGSLREALSIYRDLDYKWGKKENMELLLRVAKIYALLGNQSASHRYLDVYNDKIGKKE